MTGLGYLTSFPSSSEAFGINDLQQVAGVAFAGVAFPNEAFLWESGVGMTGLGFLNASSPFSVAHGINNLGQVVGRSRNGSGQVEPFLWEQGAGMIGLGFLGSVSRGRCLLTASVSGDF